MKTLYKLFGILLYLSPTAITAYAQKPDSDLLLKQALYETNINANYQKAIKIAETALAISPDYTDIRILLGRLYFLTGEYEQARKQLIWVVNQHPSHQNALNYLINLESESGNRKRAITYIDQSLQYSDSQDLILKKASLLAADKQYKEAYLTLEPLLAARAQDSTVNQAYLNMHLQAGSISMQAGDWNNARKEYLAVLLKDPANETAINQLYAIDIESKNYEEALYYADLGLKHYPLSENFLFKKSCSSWNNGATV